MKLRLICRSLGILFVFSLVLVLVACSADEKTPEPQAVQAIVQATAEVLQASVDATNTLSAVTQTPTAVVTPTSTATQSTPTPPATATSTATPTVTGGGSGESGKAASEVVAEQATVKAKESLTSTVAFESIDPSGSFTKTFTIEEAATRTGLGAAGSILTENCEETNEPTMEPCAVLTTALSGFHLYLAHGYDQLAFTLIPIGIDTDGNMTFTPEFTEKLPNIVLGPESTAILRMSGDNGSYILDLVVTSIKKGSNGKPDKHYPPIELSLAFDPPVSSLKQGVKELMDAFATALWIGSGTGDPNDSSKLLGRFGFPKSLPK